MNFKNIYKSLGALALASTLLLSCETTELDLLENPNALQVDQFSPDFLLNNIQLSTATFFEQVTEEGMELTRILHFFGGDYFSGFGTGQLNGPYGTVYSGMLPDINLLLSQTIPDGLTTHTGIAQILEAYVLMTMVDYLGDIPLEEATQGMVIENPALTDDAEVYAFVESLLMEARANLSGDLPPLNPTTDLYFPGTNGSDRGRWVALANTLLLKLNLQTKLVNNNAAQNINQLLNQELILTSDRDFQFTYGTVDQNPDSRHPIFSRNYDNGVNDYQSNSFMDMLLNDKTVDDPRVRFYFYRQNDALGNQSQIPCLNQPRPGQFTQDDPFCFVTNEDNGDLLWFGRDHGNNDPIPPDNAFRANWGPYPVGGRFDDDSFDVTGDRNQGLFGAGISPIMLSSFTNFMLAEAALTLGTNGDPRAFLEDGIRQSILKVINFGSLDPNEFGSFLPLEAGGTGPSIDLYIDEVLANYDAATTDEDRLRIIAEEYFIALYGNGVEAYNTYRRTGQPDNLQPMRTPSPGVYIRSFFYPTNAVNNNTNLNQKPDQTVPVFWDTNPEGFVD